MSARKLDLSKLEGEIQKLTCLRGASETLDEYCSYTLQLRHYKNILQRAKRLETDRRYFDKDGGVNDI